MTYFVKNNLTLLHPTINEKVNGRQEYENAFYKYEGSKLARGSNSRVLLLGARDHLLSALKTREGLDYMTRAMQAVTPSADSSYNDVRVQAIKVGSSYGGATSAVFQEMLRDYVLSSLEHTRVILEKTKT